MGDLARSILEAVTDLGLRRGVLASGARLVQSERWRAFVDAAEHAIDRLIDADAATQRNTLAEALGNARADVAHVVRELDRVLAERDAAREDAAAMRTIADAARRELARLHDHA